VENSKINKKEPKQVTEPGDVERLDEGEELKELGGGHSNPQHRQ